MKKQQADLLAMMGLLAIVWAAGVSTACAADFQPLMGRWHRTDGGNVIVIGRT